VVVASSEETGGKRVFRVDEQRYRKPMTIEEAMLEMDRKRDYVVFRDAETDRVSVLLRRRDGHFDIVDG
jgi:putative sigma-54 modulation protein